METRDITRFEVIDHRTGGEGRVFVANPCQVDLASQDGGKTLKVFVTDAEEGVQGSNFQPKSAAEIHRDQQPLGTESNPTTIQQTGKGHKTGQVVGFVIAGLGVLMGLAAKNEDNLEVGITFFFLGLAVSTIAKITGWWKHG